MEIIIGIIVLVGKLIAEDIAIKRSNQYVNMIVRRY